MSANMNSQPTGYRARFYETPFCEIRWTLDRSHRNRAATGTANSPAQAEKYVAAAMASDDGHSTQRGCEHVVAMCVAGCRGQAYCKRANEI